MTTTPREPTGDECNARAPIEFAGHGGTVTGFACWYPQMGGYSGKAVVLPQGGCFDVWVWHDGDFPFSETDGRPAFVHHCMAEQFIRFGQWVSTLPGMEKA